MRTASVFLACFACMGHGRNMESQSSSSFEESDPLRRLAALILALDNPEVGWQMGGHPSDLVGRNLQSPRSAQPIMKKTKKGLAVSPELVDEVQRQQDDRQQRRLARQQEKAEKAHTELLSGARKPETVEELYEVMKNKAGEEEAMKFIVERAAKTTQRLPSYIEPGHLLPRPRDGFDRLYFVDKRGGEVSCESLSEAVGDKRTFVLIASADSTLPERVRNIFSEMNSLASQLDAAVLGVSAANGAMMGKFARKKGISFPFASDQKGAWLDLLKLDRATDQLVIHVVDATNQTVVTTFDGSGHFAPPMLARIVARAVKRRAEELATLPPSAFEPPEPAPDAVPEEEYEAAFESTAPDSSTLDDLQAENRRLKDALQDAGILEQASKLASENEKLKAALAKSRARKAANEAAKQANIEAAR